MIPVEALAFLFILAMFLGLELISKVPATLHTPLMSGSNAISGITIIGAMGLASQGNGWSIFLGSLAVGFASINIYTQVGLITLIGLVAKNGILMVEFANQVRAREGLDKRTAVEKAAAVRLRPILMTTAAMIFAMVPLLTASGAGAVSRFNIGLVIASGLGIGTLFTLFVVPAFYLLLTGEIEHQQEQA